MGFWDAVGVMGVKAPPLEGALTVTDPLVTEVNVPEDVDVALAVALKEKELALITFTGMLAWEIFTIFIPPMAAAAVTVIKSPVKSPCDGAVTVIVGVPTDVVAFKDVRLE